MAEADRLLLAFSQGASTLFITSGGGDALAGIKIGEAIHERGVRVIVQKYCISACASYILPASPNAELDDGAIIGLHNTITSIYSIAKAKDRSLAERLYGSGARLEAKFYDELKINRILLTLPQYEVQPICMGVARDAAGKEIEVFGTSRVTFWVPSPQTLSHYGYRVKGRFSATKDELQASVRARFPDTVNISLTADLTGQSIEVTPNQIGVRLSGLPVCPPNIGDSTTGRDALAESARMRRDADHN